MQNIVTKPRLDLAAGLSRATVKRLRSGRGHLASLRKALDAACLDLKGLPPGSTWGARVAVLRKRRGLSQNEVARRAGVGRDAIVKLEKRSVGRLDVLRAVLRALGTQLAFKEKIPGGFYSGAALSSTRTDWRTPQSVLNRLYTIFAFDLDAAAATPPNVRARIHYGAADDGLFRPWFGTTFINPPYGRATGLWVAKCRREVASGRARTVVALLPARVGTRWWHENVVGSAAAVFLPSRLRFDDGKNTAPFDAALVLWGVSDEEVQHVVSRSETATFPVSPLGGKHFAGLVRARHVVGHEARARCRCT